MRKDLLSIFLEDFRGPRKTVFRLKIMRLRSAGNHGTLWAKSTNFKGLVFVPKMQKLLLWDLKWKGKTQINVQVAQEWKMKVYRMLKPFW